MARRNVNEASVELLTHQVAKESAEGLRQVLSKLESMSESLARLTEKHEHYDEIQKQVLIELRGAGGQESLQTRMRLSEEAVNHLRRDLDTEKNARAAAQTESRARIWQIWMAIIGAFITTIIASGMTAIISLSRAAK